MVDRGLTTEAHILASDERYAGADTHHDRSEAATALGLDRTDVAKRRPRVSIEPVFLPGRLDKP